MTSIETAPSSPAPNPGARLRALIVDDHQLLRGGLRLLLKDMVGVEECYEAGSIEEALSVVSSTDALDLVTFDLSLPGMAGVEALTALVEALPTARVVVVSRSESRDDILGALGAGAHGYVPKSLTSEQTAEAIQEVLAGRIYAPLALHRTEKPAPPAPPKARQSYGEHSFTARQTAVLETLLTGASTRKIATQLGLAEGTVKIHLAAIYRILGVHSRAEVIAKLK